MTSLDIETVIVIRTNYTSCTLRVSRNGGRSLRGGAACINIRLRGPADYRTDIITYYN